MGSAYIFRRGQKSRWGGVPLKEENEAIKSWLGRFRELSQDIDHLEQRLETLRSRLENPGAANLSGQPRAPGFEGDRIGQALAVIDDLERELREVLAQRWAVRQEIEGAVKQIKGPGFADRRTVLRCRYLDLLSWPDVVDLMFGGKVDFLDKMDGYTRRAYKIHGAAIAALAEILKDSGLLPGEGDL